MSTTISTYFEVTKPNIWYLLVFTAIVGVIVASGSAIPIATLILVVIAVTMGSAGANTLTGYFDRDIDKIMSRTKMRPIPSKRIYPASKALFFGLALSILSVSLAYYLNPLTAGLMLFGLLDNVVVYSKILKRRNPINIILGGFSGGAPVLIGYAAVTNTLDLLALTMGALVVIWIPSHIWSLALHSKEDYKRANVPMLPVVVSEKTSVLFIAFTSLLLVIFSLVPLIFRAFGGIYMGVVIVGGVVMIMLNIWLIWKPNSERAWVVFKYSSPYLALIFLAMMIDALI